jgi:hypothetical protein
MMEKSNPACKCCDGPTILYHSYDLSRTCMDKNGPVFSAASISVPYYRCRKCEFVFTPYFDAWSNQQMAEGIYNCDYILADPEFSETRPKFIAGAMDQFLAPMKSALTILDYGGGAGRFAAELKTHGFDHVQCFDPHFSTDAMPGETFDLVTAFEVAEHAVDPISSFRDAWSLVARDGALLFSTALRDRNLEKDWWYIAPRNGHVSIHSYLSLQRVAAKLGAMCLSLNDNLHVLYRTPYSPVARQIAASQHKSALYAASLRGVRSFIQTAKLFGQLGLPPGSGHTRHLSRALLRSWGIS